MMSPSSRHAKRDSRIALYESRYVKRDAGVVDVADIRKLSKALYGNGYRLEVAAAVADADTEIVTAHGLASDIGVPDNLVTPLLKGFVQAGVLEDMPRVEGQRFRYYRRLDSPYWVAATDVLRQWKAASSPIR